MRVRNVASATASGSVRARYGITAICGTAIGVDEPTDRNYEDRPGEVVQGWVVYLTVQLSIGLRLLQV